METLRRHSIPVLFVFLGVLLSTLYPIEPSHETWGYWTLSRILKETWSFPIMDRGPLYVLYLLLFAWIPYPISTEMEYILSSIFLSLSLYIFSLRYFPMYASVLSSLVWIPMLQQFEPPTQKIAMAFSLWGLMVRSYGSRNGYVWSYALFLCAYFTRSTYIVFCILFILYDVYAIRKNLSPLFPRLYRDWPLIGAILFWLIVIFQTSPHSWNNVYISSTRWFPHDGKSFSLIQNYNWAYILDRYGSFEGKDFYFTHQEVFPGAKNDVEMFVSNPPYVFRIWKGFLYAGIVHISQMTILGVVSLPFLLLCSVSVLIIYLSMRKKSIDEYLYLGASYMILFASLLSAPTPRYLVPIIPVLILCTHSLWKYIQIHTRWKHPAISVMVILICSSGITMWNKEIAYIMVKKQISRPSVWASEIRPYLQECHGIMTLEHTYIAAFFPEVPLTRVYDVFEIPPGKDISYTGLRPERVNCLLLSHASEKTKGASTNVEIRYNEYILPYEDLLLSKGAKLIQIPSYGRITIYNNI